MARRLASMAARDHQCDIQPSTKEHERTVFFPSALLLFQPELVHPLLLLQVLLVIRRGLFAEVLHRLLLFDFERGPALGRLFGDLGPGFVDFALELFPVRYRVRLCRSWTPLAKGPLRGIAKLCAPLSLLDLLVRPPVLLQRLSPEILQNRRPFALEFGLPLGRLPRLFFLAFAGPAFEFGFVDGRTLLAFFPSEQLWVTRSVH